MAIYRACGAGCLWRDRCLCFPVAQREAWTGTQGAWTRDPHSDPTILIAILRKREIPPLKGPLAIVSYGACSGIAAAVRQPFDKPQKLAHSWHAAVGGPIRHSTTFADQRAFVKVAPSRQSAALVDASLCGYLRLCPQSDSGTVAGVKWMPLKIVSTELLAAGL